MNTLLDKLNDTSFNIADGAAGGITVAALLEMLPHLSAILGVVWISLRIYVTIRDDILRKNKDGNK